MERRLSSAYYPQSNGRAEAAVKSAKRILLGNINPLTGALDTDAAARAIMAHRNTPAQDSGIAPSIMLFGRPLRDHLPVLDRKLRVEWGAIADAREMELAKRLVKTDPSAKKELDQLNVGDCVQIQNQTGNHPKRWFNTGVVGEALPNRQYNVVVDGSRRISLRNRRFLKKIDPICRKQRDLPELEEGILPKPYEMNAPQETIRIESIDRPMEPPSVPITSSAPPLPPPSASPSSVPPTKSVQPARRSTREKVPFKRFSAQLRGKSHDG